MTWLWPLLMKAKLGAGGSLPALLRGQAEGRLEAGRKREMRKTLGKPGG